MKKRLHDTSSYISGERSSSHATPKKKSSDRMTILRRVQNIPGKYTHSTVGVPQ